MTATPTTERRPTRGAKGSSQRDTVLGIDLGTSSVKVVLTTAGAQVLAQSSESYRVDTPHPGWAESDPRDWRRAIIAAVREVVAKANTPTIVGIGLSGQMHGVTVTDDQYRPLRAAILWADSRAGDQLGRYTALPAIQLANLQNPLTPGMAGPILGWLRQHESETIERTRWALQPKDWVRAWMTGQ